MTEPFSEPEPPTIIDFESVDDYRFLVGILIKHVPKIPHQQKKKCCLIKTKNSFFGMKNPYAKVQVAKKKQN